jgi:hypothetical protein
MYNGICLKLREKSIDKKRSEFGEKLLFFVYIIRVLKECFDLVSPRFPNFCFLATAPLQTCFTTHI